MQFDPSSVATSEVAPPKKLNCNRFGTGFYIYVLTTVLHLYWGFLLRFVGLAYFMQFSSVFIWILSKIIGKQEIYQCLYFELIYRQQGVHGLMAWT